MTNRKLKIQLQEAFQHASPPTLPEDVMNACVPSEESEELPHRRVIPWRAVAAIAAVLVLITVGVWQWPQTAPPIALMAVSLDVNPSITLEVDDNETIVAVSTLNEDGSTVVDDRQLAGHNVQSAIAVLVDTMLQNGYLSDNANSILISVDGPDEARTTALEQKLASAVQTHLADGQFDGAVLSQTLSSDDMLAQQAARYGISYGKAMLINRIIEADPLKTFENLAGLPINDLNLLCHASRMPKVNSSGNASDKSYIGKDAACTYALTHLNVTPEQVNALEAELDCENGVMCYEVEFVYNGAEYEYEIHAVTGDILSVESEEAEEDDDDDHRTTITTARPTVTTTAPSTSPSSATKSTALTTSPSAKRLSAEQVRSIVLAHAKISASVEAYEIELDEEHGTAVYEVEFRYGGTEYEYRVDAVTGAVLSSRTEPKPTTPPTSAATTVTTAKTTTVTVATTTTAQTKPIITSTTSTALLTKQQVKAIVLAHAGVAEAEIKGYEIELDRANGTRVYEVEFRCRGKEYEYRVNAVTGEILFGGTETDRD